MSQSQATPNLPDTLPANYDFSQGAGQQAPQGQTQAPNPQASQTLPDTLPADYFDKRDPPADPRKTGEITNDVGQKVIVPKDGESFSDTMKRAVAYHKSLTPEQQQAALDAETKTIPAKALEAGIGGPLAAVGSYAAGAMGIAGAGAVADALPSVIMHTTEGVKALNAWALKNPVSAILLYHAVKELLPGAKKAMGFVKSVPMPPIE